MPRSVNDGMWCLHAALRYGQSFEKLTRLARQVCEYQLNRKKATPRHWFGVSNPLKSGACAKGGWRCRSIKDRRIKDRRRSDHKECSRFLTATLA